MAATTTTEELTSYQLAEQLNTQVWQESWLHGDFGPPHAQDRGENIPDMFKIKDVTQPGFTLAPDDLLVVVEHGQPFRRQPSLNHRTAREVLTADNIHFVRVLTVAPSGKAIEVAPVHTPFGDWTANLDTFGTPHGAPVRILPNRALNREIGYLGNVNDVHALLSSHPRYTAWQDAHRDAHAEFDRDRAEQDAAFAAAEARRAPFRDKIAELHDIAGEELLELRTWVGGSTADDAVHDGVGVVRFANGWFTRIRLDVYLSGLFSMGRITGHQYLSAVQLVRELGLAPVSSDRSTAHQAKGLEWDYVGIGADFAERKPFANRKGQRLVRSAEAMLASVAITRARLGLDAENLVWVDELDGIR